MIPANQSLTFLTVVLIALVISVGASDQGENDQPRLRGHARKLPVMTNQSNSIDVSRYRVSNQAIPLPLMTEVAENEAVESLDKRTYITNESRSRNKWKNDEPSPMLESIETLQEPIQEIDEQLISDPAQDQISPTGYYDIEDVYGYLEPADETLQIEVGIQTPESNKKQKRASLRPMSNDSNMPKPLFPVRIYSRENSNLTTKDPST